MDEYDFDVALEDMIRELKEKQPFYLESMQREQDMITADFHEHLIATIELTQGSFYDAKFPDTASDEYEELSGSLIESMQRSFEKVPHILNGEVRISGEGVYVTTESDNEGIEILEPGWALQGTITQYLAAPMLITTDGEFAPNVTQDSLPDLFLLAKNVTLFNEDGEKEGSFEQIHISFTRKTFDFRKIIRHPLINAPVEQQEVAPRQLIALFRGGEFRDFCNEIENYLNFSDDEDESLQQQHIRAHEQLIAKTQEFDMQEGQRFVIQATETLDNPMSDVQLDDNSVVEYLEPVICEVGDTWRVAHGFWICNDENDCTTVVHILPEDIQSIRSIS